MYDLTKVVWRQWCAFGKTYIFYRQPLVDRLVDCGCSDVLFSLRTEGKKKQVRNARFFNTRF